MCRIEEFLKNISIFSRKVVRQPLFLGGGTPSEIFFPPVKKTFHQKKGRLFQELHGTPMVIDLTTKRMFDLSEKYLARRSVMYFLWLKIFHILVAKGSA